MKHLISHSSLVSMRKAFGVRLVYLVQRMTEETTGSSIAAKCRVSPSTISLLKNGKWEKVSLPRLMCIADKLKLSYQVSIIGKNGKVKTEVVYIASAITVADEQKFRKDNKVISHRGPSLSA